ncbi:MAG: alpha/beta-hydrolase family protein [Phycisphaerales bacterium]|nr:alpha/beta-hydrolase family protein [Phycisphaerales bacterium]
MAARSPQKTQESTAPPPAEPSSRPRLIPSLTLRLCIAGVLLGTVFFAFSLTPSLVPRPSAVQGVLSGLSFAAGYAIGAAGYWLWVNLHLPTTRPRATRIIQRVAFAVCLLAAATYLWQSVSWQNSVRAIMGMEPVDRGLPILLGLISATVFLLVLGLTRLFWWVFRRLSLLLRRFIPARVSHIVGVVVTAWIFWSVIDGVLINTLLRAADRSFQQLDALIDPDLPVPTDPVQTGSEESLVRWEDLGRSGREFVAGGPDAEELGAFFGQETPAPVRVYVGLNAAETPEERAQLALEELIRAGGFERSVLLLVTPTGTGWVDPAAQDTFEYLHRGDTATVAVQYSYLNSPLVLLTQAEYGVQTARALFAEIYGHWRTLPKDTRPRLYLFGLSLGSINSDRSFDLYDIIDDPFDGILWSGPPFRNQTWANVTRERDRGSTQWLPTFRSGSVVRFMNQSEGPNIPASRWGDFRILILQYASDPITFFSSDVAWREPDWMRQPRGPDVSPKLRWYPVVTMLHLGADMIVGNAPPGFGHTYAATDYIDAWLALTEPAGWTEADIQRLRERFD